MTEQQPYEVIATRRGFELRRYPAHVVAEVEMRGSFERTGNAAFRPLVSYIGGRNREGTKVSMTAPVVQVPTPQPDTYLVSFVMPAGSTVAELPVPVDSSVTVHDVPEHLAAATRFSGRWSKHSYDEHVAALRAAIEAAGLVAIDEPRFARFDPPWRPWFLRRNEVVLPVTEPTKAANADSPTRTDDP
jgi:hypothetical protein